MMKVSLVIGIAISLLASHSAISALTQTGIFDTDGTAWEVVVRGSYAYIADDDGLYVVDISDPTSPDSVTKWVAPASPVETIVIDGNYAYLACGREGVRIVSISNPDTLTLTGTFSPRGSADDVGVLGDYAYVANNNRGLRIVDISDKADPVEVASADPPGGSAQGLDIAGNYVYVSYGQAGLRIFDISDIIAGTPENFNENDLVGEYDAAGEANNVNVVGDYAYCAWGNSGIRVLDITDPANPIEIANNNTPGSALSAEVVGDYVYVADDGGGLRIMDISGLDTITVPIAALPEVDNYPTNPNEEYNNVFATGGYTYIADQADGLRILETADYPSTFQRSFSRLSWEFIGVPTTVVSGNPVTLFGDDFDDAAAGQPRWRISRWDDASQKYVRHLETDFPDIAGDQDPVSMAPGLGYWLIQDTVDNCVLTITADQNNGVVPQDASYSVSLSAGRSPNSSTQVANPFHYPYDLGTTYFSNDGGLPIPAAAAAVDSGYINANVYQWDAANKQYITNVYTDTIPAWEGFWVIQTDEDVILDILFSPDGFAPAPPMPKGKGTGTPNQVYDFRLDLSVMTADGDYKDSYNRIGIGPGFSDEYDPYDAFELTPMSSQFVQLYFPHYDWEVQPGVYSNDLRNSDMTGGKSWEFSVRTYNLPDQEYILSWSDLDKTDSKLRFSLIDHDHYEIISDMRLAGSYRFRAGGDSETIHFELAVSYRSTQPVVADYRLLTAYPNPFNGSTRIFYEIPSAQNVKLSLFDMLGRRVAILSEGYHTSGVHSKVWQADRNASGTYLLKMELENGESASRVTLFR